MTLLLGLPFLAAWVGHACLAIVVLNNLYGRALPKVILKPFRLLVGAAVLAFPLVAGLIDRPLPRPTDFSTQPMGTAAVYAPVAYLSVCLLVGGLLFPIITVRRLVSGSPATVVEEATVTVDLWPQFGRALVGDGKWTWLPRLPGNCIFRVDFTELTLSVPGLPKAWDGLTVLHLSDLHFHGTPSRLFFERVVGRIAAQATPDVVVLAGDYVDTDAHREWIGPVLGPLRWNECGLAVLGNHDVYHDPDGLRSDLTTLGYRVLGNGWQRATIRGVECAAVGHEGPWFGPPPDLSDAPPDLFRLGVSHTPDNFYWGQANRVNLMFCGHVHGGQVRLPLVGSIFIPSIYSRRFDRGVFEEKGTVMVVGRGLSGKEPLRFRCHPQVLRVTLRARTG